MSDWAALRRFPRYPIQLPVLYKLKGPALQTGVGWTRNLSEGGAWLELAERLPPPGSGAVSGRAPWLILTLRGSGVAAGMPPDSHIGSPGPISPTVGLILAPKVVRNVALNRWMSWLVTEASRTRFKSCTEASRS